MTAETPFISLRNVRKVFRSEASEFLAVSDVTMDVQEGELVSLVGPSGCGKTTVLKILAGLHEADGGTVRIGNANTRFDPGRDIGMVFQQALLLKWRTVLDNVLLPAEIVGLPMRAARSRARDLLNLAQLLSDQRNFDEAVHLLERALAITEASFGPEHRETVLCLKELGRALKGTGDAARAVDCLMRASAITGKPAKTVSHETVVGDEGMLA